MKSYIILMCNYILKSRWHTKAIYVSNFKYVNIVISYIIISLTYPLIIIVYIHPTLLSYTESIHQVIQNKYKYCIICIITCNTFCVFISYKHSILVHPQHDSYVCKLVHYDPGQDNNIIFRYSIP